MKKCNKKIMFYVIFLLLKDSLNSPPFVLFFACKSVRRLHLQRKYETKRLYMYYDVNNYFCVILRKNYVLKLKQVFASTLFKLRVNHATLNKRDFDL